MKTGKTTIRASQSGWVVYHGNDVDNFVPFAANEPERFIDYIAEHVAGISLDQLVEYRQRQMSRTHARLLNIGAEGYQ